MKFIPAESGAKGITYGNSGGKDSALAGILCKAPCEYPKTLVFSGAFILRES
ncbi:MAG: hypothetical protein E7487_06155 [Ruminococcaceae bacterium]|nr:hypothetical protein [Oscillospiraceae bacterium]